MDPVTIVMLAIAGLFVLAILLLGRFYPGSGAEQLDWRPTRSPELEAANEVDDLDQMREAVNRRRRRRGQPELTEDELHGQVAADLRDRRAHAGEAGGSGREPEA